MSGPFEATEWWFIRRGLPHAIPNYTAADDVWTRAAPWLVLIAFVEVFTTFSDQVSGWAQLAAFTAGLAMIVAAIVAVNLVRGRTAFQRPDDVGPLELVAFATVPALGLWWFGDGGWVGALSLLLVNVVLFGIIYVVVSYGLVPALRVGFEQSVGQLLAITQLVARGLPILLLITAFVFLNAEMWQVASDFPVPYYAIAIGLLVTLAFGFLALRVPREIDALATFRSWDECAACFDRVDAPVDMPDLAGSPPPPDLDRFERINVGMLLTIAQVVQTLLVGIATAVFYVAFGLLAVRRETILQWTTAEDLDPIAAVEVLGSEIVLTWEHLAVAGFIGAFSLLQFAVSSVTDDAYRDEFHDDVAGDVRSVLAVRTVVRATSS